MAHSYARLYFHIVFSTKGRKRLIDAELEERLHAMLGGIVRNLDGAALAVGGVEDHVHILASLRAKTAPADAIRDIKANASGWVHQEFPDRSQFAWQTGYGAFSVSASSVEDVRKYVLTQREHHRKMTFEEEFLGLLKKHEVEYDERFVFD
ncbi:MAG: IS200/IS605 family transposase [Pirellulaceae bacterium]